MTTSTAPSLDASRRRSDSRPGPSIVAVSGNVQAPSRTKALVAAITDALATRLGADARLIEIAGEGLPLLAAPTRAHVTAEGEAILRAIEGADLLVVGTPVYRASYTGALKHVFDLVAQDSLAGTPVILSATGGSRMHGLVTEHQLRPLMAFFGALTVPTTVFATQDDFAGYRVADAGVLERIQRAADEAVALAALPAATAGARQAIRATA